MGYTIMQERKKQGISQQELAEKSGVSRATISALEGGKLKVTTTETLRKIAAALGKKPGDLFLE